MLSICSPSDLVEGVSSAKNDEIYIGVEAYSALKKKAAGQVVYSTVLPVVNIKSWVCVCVCVYEMQVASIQNSLVEVSVR